MPIKCSRSAGPALKTLELPFDQHADGDGNDHKQSGNQGMRHQLNVNGNTGRAQVHLGGQVPLPVYQTAALFEIGEPGGRRQRGNPSDIELFQPW